MLGIGLVGLVVACQPGRGNLSQATAEPTQGDPFAVVRATADAAYRAGRADLERGQLEQALVELDRAKTNDPDNRPEIQQALDETVRRIQGAPPATETAISSAAGSGALVTPPVVAQTQLVRATAQVAATAVRTAAVAAQTSVAQGPATAGPLTATNATAGPTVLVRWTDGQGRFSIGAPAGWQTLDAPPAMFGTGVVGFREPSGQAELDVSVDTTTRAVSPELYAASMELAMQQAPGYALDSVQPGTTAGNPSVKRVFSQTRRDAAGRDYPARGFQVAIVRGSTAYVLSASSPADRYAAYASTFERMVDSLAFS